MLGASLVALMLVATPLPSDFVRGMTFAHVHSRSWGYGSDRAREELGRLRSVGVDWIAISPFAYQRSVDSPLLYYGFGDPTLLESDLEKVAAHAHELGIKVLLKPHIWSSDFWRAGKWPGDIAMKNAEDDAAWWRRYSEYILAQAEIAARAKIDALSIGHELVRMTGKEHTARWRALIASVRAIYKGPLIYGAHHDREAQEIEFWDALDAIGVHAYFPLGGADLERGDADAVARAWKPHLDALQQLTARTKKPVVFTEIGFPSHRGALTTPWHADGSLPVDEDLQARAYEGTLRAIAGAQFVRGVFWWKWFSGGPANPHEREPYDPAGKAAEVVLRRWFGGR
jgi:hypothetical protein